MASNTLSEVTRELEKKGYTQAFVVTEQGIEDTKTKRFFRPEDFQIVESYRFEGNSDPDDSEVIYALESKYGAKGMLVDAYGMYADPLKSDFINQIELFHKVKDSNLKK